jgi:YARHG domain/TIR domain
LHGGRSMVDVFISYSRDDRGAVRRIAEAVEALGYDVWWDDDLPPHMSYGDVITSKIGAAKAAIVVWSSHSVQSEWVRAEADVARNQKKLIQTALDNVMPPLPFNQIQFAEIGDWRGEPEHPGWRKVKASLAELCGRAAPERTKRPVAPPDRVEPPRGAPPVKWPLYAGIGVGVLALAAAGWIATRGPAPSPAGPAEIEPTLTAVTPPAPSATSAASAEPASQPAAAPAPAVAPPVASTEGMVFPDSSVRLLTGPEIANLGPATLEIARNEIFARKGRRFARADLRDYFSQFEWYRPVASEVTLNAIEQQNVDRLRRAEARYGQ